MVRNEFTGAAEAIKFDKQAPGRSPHLAAYDAGASAVAARAHAPSVVGAQRPRSSALSSGHAARVLDVPLLHVLRKLTRANLDVVVEFDLVVAARRAARATDASYASCSVNWRVCARCATPVNISAAAAAAAVAAAVASTRAVMRKSATSTIDSPRAAAAASASTPPRTSIGLRRCRRRAAGAQRAEHRSAPRASANRDRSTCQPSGETPRTHRHYQRDASAVSVLQPRHAPATRQHVPASQLL